MTDPHEPRAVEVQLTGDDFSRSFLVRCRNAADENLLCGWVRSEPVSHPRLGRDGVLIHLEGLGYQIDNYLNWLRGGVEGVRIGRILIEPAERQRWSDFELLS